MDTIRLTMFMEVCMYIVKRTSLSGGTEYLIEAVHSRSRWDKKTKSLARRFASRSHAYMLARNALARVEMVPARKTRKSRRR